MKYDTPTFDKDPRSYEEKKLAKAIELLESWKPIQAYNVLINLYEHFEEQRGEKEE